MKVVLFAVGLARVSATIPKAPKAYDSSRSRDQRGGSPSGTLGGARYQRIERINKLMAEGIVGADLATPRFLGREPCALGDVHSLCEAEPRNKGAR